MPYKPLRPCKFSGCPRLTNDPRGYCPEHLPVKYKEEESRRESSYRRGYDVRWQKARQAFLRAHPLCVECQKEGRITPANVVDHIITHKGNMELFWDETNWQPLCKFHHDQKTAKEDGAFGKVIENS